MAGIRNGVAVQMCAEEPCATYMRCYGHALNLAASDTVKKNKILRDILDTVFEITKLLKFSPKHDASFTKLKQEIQELLDSIHCVQHVGQFMLLPSNV